MHVSLKDFKVISCALVFVRYSHMLVAFPRGMNTRACFGSRNFPVRPPARKAALPACCAGLFQGSTSAASQPLSLLCRHLFLTVSSKEEMVFGICEAQRCLWRGLKRITGTSWVGSAVSGTLGQPVTCLARSRFPGNSRGENGAWFLFPVLPQAGWCHFCSPSKGH